MVTSIDGLEAHVGHVAKIQRLRARNHSVRPSQPVGDGNFHVGRPQLGNHGMVGVLNHGMDHTLGMDHHLNLVGPHAEQKMGLDHFQGLVHHGGGVNRYFASHHPIRMGTGLRGRDIAKRARVALAKGAARGCQNNFVNPLRPNIGIIRQGLKHRRVLAVNWQKLGPAEFDRLQKIIAADHQCLFVGQQQALARPRRSQARGQPGGANNGSHHGIHQFMGGHHADRFRTPKHLRGQAKLAALAGKLLSMVRAGHHCEYRTILHALLQQNLGSGRCAQGKHLKAFRVT